MAEPPSIASPHRFGRLWALSLATTLTMAAIHLGSTLLWRGRLPDPVATHWDGAGIADGTGSLATWLLTGVFTIGLLGVLMPLGARSIPGNRTGTPLLAGLGNGLLVGIGTFFLSGLVGQLDEPAALGTHMSAPVLIGGLAVAIGWGSGCALLVRAALAPRAAPGITRAAKADPEEQLLAPGSAISSTVRGPAWLLAVLGALAAGMAVMALVAGQDSAVAYWSLVPSIVILLVASVVFMSGRVLVDDAGIRVYGGGIFKLLHVKPADIELAEARDITPGEFGGWGLRFSGAGVAFIVGAGPGVIVNRTHGGARIYSVAAMDEARTMAGLLNSLAAEAHPGRSST